MDEADEKLRKTLFQKYAEDGDHFGDEWFDKFFENSCGSDGHDLIYVDWLNETNCKNYSSGDESEKLLKLDDREISAHWIETTYKGVQGPFASYDRAVEALGYRPDCFPPESEDDSDEDG